MNGGLNRKVSPMKYKKIGYKYELAENEHFNTPVTGFEIDVRDPASRMQYAFLGKDGNLVVFTGYQWDGASGPTIDDNTNMRASLEHDVFYQMLREEYLGPGWRKIVDKVLFQSLREDGMPWWRAKYYYWGVRLGGGPSADPKNQQIVYEAP